MLNDKRILATGGKGFIGSHLMERLIAIKCLVIYSHHINLKNNWNNYKRIKYYEYDVTDNKELKEDTINLAFFDDHVSYYDRVLVYIKHDIGVSIFDDAVGITSVHPDD